MFRETDEWFSKEVLYKRYVYVFLWSLAIQSTLTWIIKLLGSPLASLFGLTPVSISAVVVCQLYLALLLTCLCVLFYRSVKVYPELLGSPITVIFEFLRPHNWLQALCFATLGIFWSHCLLYIAPSLNYRSFWVQTPKCIQESSSCCVSELHFFVILFGAFTGVSFCVNYYFKHLYCLKFETVQQLKFPCAKITLKKQVTKSAFVTIKSIRYYYLIYYFLGFIPKYIVTEYAFQHFCESTSLTTLAGLFDLELLWTTYFVGFLIHVSWSSVLALIQIFLTERFIFPIETSFEKDQVQLLTNAISSQNNPLLQHLAFQNLSLVSQYASAERGKIFAISIPGGHPHTWNQILSRCLEVISEFRTSLCLAAAAENATAVKGTSGSQLNIGAFLSQSPQSNGLSQHSVTGSPLTTSQRAAEPWNNSSLRTSTLRARNMAEKDMVVEKSMLAESSLHHAQNGKAYVYKGYVMEKLQKTCSNFINKPAVKFLITEPSERKIEKLHCKCHLVIWSVEALSYLVKASYNEDHNGVVQWSLSKIISSLLELQMAMERNPKNLLHTRDTWLAVPRSLCLKQSLHVALSSAIYHITCSFKHHMKYIELSDEHQKRIDRYLQMKE